MQPNQRKKRVSLIVFGVLVGVWLLVGAGVAGAWLSSHLNKSDQSNNSQQFDGNTVISADEADVTSVVNKVSPSVVSIVTTQQRGYGYFRQTMEGAGTGIIISKDGYVLTNKHVVSGARSVRVVMSDGTNYDEVEAVGADPLNDIAFLKIKNAKDLPAAAIGDSSTVRVGQRVVAIGNSLGQYQNTVTSGIISGLGRPVVAASDELGTNVESLTDLLQTDAAINRGNSGGPLINMAGQVIGVNTAIVSNAQSIGFAIPINATKGLIRGVMKDGKVQKAYVGVQYIPITPDIKSELKLSESNGALVSAQGSQGPAVNKGGPADRSGIREGDIITKVNDRVVGQHGGLGSLVAEFLPGEKVNLTIVRGKDTKSVEVTLDAYQP